MSEYAKKSKKRSHTPADAPKASGQAPVGDILQAYKNRISGSRTHSPEQFPRKNIQGDTVQMKLPAGVPFENRDATVWLGNINTPKKKEGGIRAKDFDMSIANNKADAIQSIASKAAEIGNKCKGESWAFAEESDIYNNKDSGNINPFRVNIRGTYHKEAKVDEAQTDEAVPPVPEEIEPQTDEAATQDAVESASQTGDTKPVVSQGNKTQTDGAATQGTEESESPIKDTKPVDTKKAENKATVIKGTRDNTLTMDYHFGPFNHGYILSVSKTSTKDAGGVDRYVTGVMKDGAVTAEEKKTRYSNKHESTADRSLLGMAKRPSTRKSAGATESSVKDGSRGWDAYTKLAGEGARFQCVRNNLDKITDNTLFYYIKPGASPDAPKKYYGISFSKLWGNWSHICDSRYRGAKTFNIPDQAIISYLITKNIKIAETRIRPANDVLLKR